MALSCKTVTHPAVSAFPGHAAAFSSLGARSSSSNRSSTSSSTACEAPAAARIITIIGVGSRSTAMVQAHQCWLEWKGREGLRGRVSVAERANARFFINPVSRRSRRLQPSAVGVLLLLAAQRGTAPRSRAAAAAAPPSAGNTGMCRMPPCPSLDPAIAVPAASGAPDANAKDAQSPRPYEDWRHQHAHDVMTTWFRTRDVHSCESLALPGSAA